MLAPAVMLVVFVLGETISLGTDFSVTAVKRTKSCRYVLVDLKVPQ